MRGSLTSQRTDGSTLLGGLAQETVATVRGSAKNSFMCDLIGLQTYLIVWERPNFYSSPALSRSLDTGLLVSGLKKDQIDLFDFYSLVNKAIFYSLGEDLANSFSCFPIVPKIACHHLGLPIINSPKPITLLGGLTSFGGAGNNYSMHVSDS
jgi:hypothetical protein